MEEDEANRQSIYHPAIPMIENSIEARWRDQDCEQLRVVLFGDGTCLIATGTGTRRAWVELSTEQADEITVFLTRRQEQP